MKQIAGEFDFDLCVIGGGVGGCAAAIEGARRGLRTVLLEKGVTLGGLATNGYVPQVAGGVRGLCREFIQRMDQAGQLRLEYPDKADYFLPIFDPECAKLVLEQMVTETGCTIFYDVTFIDVEIVGQVIKNALFHTEGGVMKVHAGCFVDATGTAQVAWAAGAPCLSGSEEYDGFNMSTTQGSRWAGADLERYQAAEEKWRVERQSLGEENPVPLVFALEETAIQRGDITRHICNRLNGFHRVVLPNTPMNDAEFSTFAFHSYHCRNQDPTDVSRQILEQHRQMEQFLSFLRKYVPGFERIRLVGIGSLPGFREGRRICGEYVLSDEEFVSGAKFPDGIARYPEVVATHHPTSHECFFIRHVHVKQVTGSAIPVTANSQECCDETMHPHGVPAGVAVYKNPDDWCEIPYRSMIPQGVDNLLAVGRCCSAQFHASSALRVIGPSMETGQAAGISAAIAFFEHILPRQVDGQRIRAEMMGETKRSFNDGSHGAL